MYKIYKNKDKYEIFSVYGQFIVSCTNEHTANYLLKKLEEEAKLFNQVKKER